MAQNPKLLAERGQKMEKGKSHPGGMLAGIKAIRPGKHRMALGLFRKRPVNK